MSRYESALDAAGERLGPQGSDYWGCLMRGVERGTLTIAEAHHYWIRDRGDELPPEVEGGQ